MMCDGQKPTISTRGGDGTVNAVKKKIESQKGASITFALLLFLVCSMVSIVVVTAGTAAAGRMSQRAETDQRYYAVTSAVELLIDDFKGKTATVEYTKETAETGVSEDSITVTKIDDSESTVSDSGIVANASKKLVGKIANPTTSTGPDDELSLVVTGALDFSALKCTIREYIKKDGRVIFEVSNAVAPGAAKYTLQVVFDARITQSKSQYTASGVSMDKVTTTLEWSLSGIEKGVV